MTMQKQMPLTNLPHERLNPLSEILCLKAEFFCLEPNGRNDADNESNLDCFSSLQPAEDVFFNNETNFLARAAYHRLTPEEEKKFSSIVRDRFCQACLLIQRQSTEDEWVAGLQQEINSWSHNDFSPVPQKKRVRRIRQVLADKISHNDSLFRQWATEVLTLLDEVDQAADELILGNLALVKIIAKKFADKGVSKEDLFQEGTIGLMKGAYRYDHTKAGFATYASFWIRQVMGKVVMDQPPTIRLPSHLHEQRTRFFKFFYKMRTEKGHVPEDKEVSLRSEVPMRVVKRFKSTPLVTSLDTPLSEDGDTCVSDLIADKCQDTADDIFNKKEACQVIEQVFAELKPREVEVLRMRYGIGESEVMTLDKIGTKFGVSRERVRQIEVKALKRLRHPVRRQKLETLL